jgi:hypothetical protein
LRRLVVFVDRLILPTFRSGFMPPHGGLVATFGRLRGSIDPADVPIGLHASSCGPAHSWDCTWCLFQHLHVGWIDLVWHWFCLVVISVVDSFHFGFDCLCSHFFRDCIVEVPVEIIIMLNSRCVECVDVNALC